MSAYLIPNLGRKFIDDKNLRQAIMYGIDRQKLAQVMGLGSQPMRSMTPEVVFPELADPKITFDLKKAQAFFARSDYGKNRSRPPLLLGMFQGGFKALAEFIQRQLKQNLNIESEIQIYGNFAIFNDGLPYDLTVFPWTPDFIDPVDLFSIPSDQIRGTAMGWLQGTYRKMLTQATAITDSKEKRIRQYKAIQDYLFHDQTVIFPLMTLGRRTIHHQRVSGLTYSPLNNHFFERLKIHTLSK